MVNLSLCEAVYVISALKLHEITSIGKMEKLGFMEIRALVVYYAIDKV